MIYIKLGEILAIVYSAVLSNPPAFGTPGAPTLALLLVARRSEDLFTHLVLSPVCPSDWKIPADRPPVCGVCPLRSAWSLAREIFISIIERFRSGIRILFFFVTSACLPMSLKVTRSHTSLDLSAGGFLRCSGHL